MPKLSAGVLVYRLREEVEVFLVHPGGPFWQKKDDGAWTIPKGEYSEGEDPKAAALREFEEETGRPLHGEPADLLTCKLPSGKLLTVFVFEGDVDETALRSNTFQQEWPPKSGRLQDFPEIDRGGWFSLDEAGRKVTLGQRQVLEGFTRWIAAKGP
jgi:predicted NUDIX family NTP pyrophosphohydrolase